MRPLRTGHRVAAVVIAAPRSTGYRVVRIGLGRLVTVMCGLAATAGMRWRSFPLHRQGNKRPDKRNQQQKSGSKPLHVVR